MKIQCDIALLGRPVVDEASRRLGRVAAAYCTLDPDMVVWFVLRLPGLRRQWRAVPAEGAHWNNSAATVLWVPFPREQVLASPIVDEDSLGRARRRGEVEAFYAAQRTLAPR